MWRPYWYERVTINIYAVLLVVTLAQGGIIIAALLTSKQSNKTANSLLSELIAIFLYYMPVNMLYNTGQIHNYSYLIRTHRSMVFSIGAGLYLLLVWT